MGLDGKAFDVYKFRSMYQGAEDDTGPIWARDNDPRCTPVGKWLRRLDLDELPQLWNVLRGDMSIVGPRPERPYFVEQFKHRIPQYMLRHKVKAGITGWAQVNGWRGNTSLEKRIEYDLYYIENWSVGLDIKIMCLTVAARLPEARLLQHPLQTAYAKNRHHRRRRVHRLTPVGNAARPRLLGRRDRQPADRRHGQHRAPGEPRLHVHQARRHQLHLRRRARRRRAALGQPGEPDRLPGAADPDAQGRRARHAQGARPRESEERAVRDRLDVGSLWRSAGAPAEGILLGQRQPDRPARRVRRGEAVRRGDDDRLPPLPRARHEDRPDLQHLRAAHAAAATAARCRRS